MDREDPPHGQGSCRRWRRRADQHEGARHHAHTGRRRGSTRAGEARVVVLGVRPSHRTRPANGEGVPRGRPRARTATTSRPDPLAPCRTELSLRLVDDPHVWASALYDMTRCASSATERAARASPASCVGPPCARTARPARGSSAGRYLSRISATPMRLKKCSTIGRQPTCSLSSSKPPGETTATLQVRKLHRASFPLPRRFRACGSRRWELGGDDGLDALGEPSCRGLARPWAERSCAKRVGEPLEIAHLGNFFNDVNAILMLPCCNPTGQHGCTHSSLGPEGGGSVGVRFPSSRRAQS